MRRRRAAKSADPTRAGDCAVALAPMTDTEKRDEPQDLADDAQEQAAPPAPADAAPGALVELPEAAVARLEEELGALRDRYLRLAAEYDNFRKRTVRERTELWAKAQIELVVRLIDALDDLARFAHVDPAQTDAKTLDRKSTRLNSSHQLTSYAVFCLKKKKKKPKLESICLEFSHYLEISDI